jgi:AhpD family alkylhydroperoxidase
MGTLKDIFFADAAIRTHQTPFGRCENCRIRSTVCINRLRLYQTPKVSPILKMKNKRKGYVMKRKRHFTFLPLVVILSIILSSSAQKKQASNSEESILQNVEKKKGFRPFPLQLMAKRDGVLPAFMAYGNMLFENGPLPPKEVYLIALAAAVVHNSPVCISAHTKSAEQNGASDDEIIQTILIAGFIGNTAPLHLAGEKTLDFIRDK